MKRAIIFLLLSVGAFAQTIVPTPVLFNGSVSASGAGAGTVTVVGGGTLTNTALVTGGGTQLIQTAAPTATMDSSGNISTPGTITAGAGSSTAGAIALTQGTTQSTGTTNVTIQAPPSVTSYLITVPSSVGSTGYMKWTVSGSNATLSSVTSGEIGAAAMLGTFASPDTAAGSITWTAPVYEVFTSAAGATRTYQLPAASSYPGRGIILYVVAGTNHVNLQPQSGAQLVLDGVLLTANNYIQATTSAAGNFICMTSDGTNWVSLGKSGTWVSSASP